MKKYLYKKSENVYKANLHCHTTLTDGQQTPAEIKKLYQAQGYSIVAFTDHNVFTDHSALNDNRFLAINGCEVDLTAPQTNGNILDNRKTYHFNLLATRPDLTTAPPLPDMPYHDINAINQYIAARRAEGFLVNYNHPYWSLHNFEDYGRLRGCFAMEIYNHGSERKSCFNGHHPQVYDDMLRSGQRLFCLATDDNHNTPGFFGGWICLNSPNLGYETVMAALAAGDFYATQGPQIKEISLEGDVLAVKCSPAGRITMHTQGRTGQQQRGEGLREAHFTLTGHEGYVRIAIRDAAHLFAYSNAYFI